MPRDPQGAETRVTRVCDLCHQTVELPDIGYGFRLAVHDCPVVREQERRAARFAEALRRY